MSTAGSIHSLVETLRNLNNAMGLQGDPKKVARLRHAWKTIDSIRVAEETSLVKQSAAHELLHPARRRGPIAPAWKSPRVFPP